MQNCTNIRTGATSLNKQQPQFYMQRAELGPLGELIASQLKTQGRLPRFTGICDYDLQDLKANCSFDIYPAGTVLGGTSVN